MVNQPPALTKKLLLASIILLGAFFRLHLIDQIPPGDDFDPAFYGLDALRILDGERPVYLETNYGRGPLFSYVIAAAYLVLGPGTLGIHMSAALIGLLTIPALYLLSGEWFKRDPPGARRQWGGILAALILALSFWHLIWSRYGVRAILIPLFFCLTIFFLLRGFRRRRRADFIAGGLLLGLGLYTYQLAQLLPLLVLAYFLYEFIARRGFTWQEWGFALLLAAAAVLVALPLAAYAYNHPGVFNQRVSGVYVLRDAASPAEQLLELLDRARQTLLLFLWQGDMTWTTNLPGRPVFNLFLAFFLLGGILIALRRWRQPRYLFLLTWLALMVAPALLADKAPLSKRALGALPAAVLFIALGLLWPLDHWLRRSEGDSRRRRVRLLYTALICAGLALSAVITYRDYFLRWAAETTLYDVFDVGVKGIGQYIALLPEEEAVYLSPTWGEHAVLKLHANRRDGIHAYNGRRCFVFPRQSDTATTFIIVPGDDKHSLPLLLDYFPQGQSTDEGLMPGGGHYFTAYQIPAGATAQFNPLVASPANWDNQIQLLGYDVPAEPYQAGDTVPVTLYYQALAESPRNDVLFLHLWGGDDLAGAITVVAQEDREPCFQSYPTSFWQPGQVIRDTFTLSLPPDIPPGTYTLATGIYTWPELQRLPLLATAGDSLDNVAILGQIQIDPQP